MSSIIEYTLSMIIGAAIMMILVRAQEQTAEATMLASNDQSVQSLCASTAEVIEYDMANIGDGVTAGSPAVLTADSSRVVFLTDLNDDGGIPDTITYYTGDSTTVTSTPNTHDRHLFRRTNLTPVQKIGLVTRFIFRYATRTGEILTMPVSSIRRIEIYTIEFSMEVQSPSGVTAHVGGNPSKYSSAFWQRTFALN
ncbi:MAG: hypothetical protein HY961_16995 [Ignavibacteriae bacterium]|nr:hypothetical protein [Ignavibacteriota bacterium]